MRLAQKFTLALVLVITFVILARAAFDTQRATKAAMERTHAAQHQLGEVLDLSIRKIWKTQGWESALKYLEEVEKKQGQVEIRWVWLQRNDLKEYQPRISSEQVLARSTSTGTISFEGILSSKLVVYKLVQLEGVPLGAIELTRSLDDIESFANEETYHNLLVAALALLVYSLVASILGRRIIGEPIARLITHAKMVAEGDFSASSKVKGHDEIGALAKEMNLMSRRLLAAKNRATRERSARVEVEDQLVHANRLASVGHITAALIHDVSTPLSIISGHASLIAEEALGPEAIKEGAKKISEQALRVGDMIHEVLIFARKGHAQKELLNLSKLLDEVASLVRPLSNAAQIAVVSSDSAAEPFHIHANGNQMRQVVMNLTINAIQAIGTGGTVSFTLSSVTPNMVELCVADDGPGIPTDIMESIFEPFFTTKEEGEGTGLGLGVCRQIVKSYGGDIRVESRPDVGTSFYVTLPLASETPQE